MDGISKFPLAWPTGWKRCAPKDRRNGRFTTGERVFGQNQSNQSWIRQKPVTIAVSVSRVRTELQRLGVRHGDFIVSSNVEVRLDGMPYSNRRDPVDPGVAVYWRKNPRATMSCMAIDQYNSVADNLAAIAATLEAMRAIERHGGAEILERAFLGFQALPPPTPWPKRWHEVLGVDPDASLAAAETSYRIRVKNTEHATGGDHDRMTELNEAIRQARLVCR